MSQRSCSGKLSTNGCLSGHPGQIDTPILAGLTPEQNEQIKAATPMGRMGRPEEIAYGSLYLCSDEAAFVTGVELVIDGGWFAQ